MNNLCITHRRDSGCMLSYCTMFYVYTSAWRGIYSIISLITVAFFSSLDFFYTCFIFLLFPLSWQSFWSMHQSLNMKLVFFCFILIAEWSKHFISTTNLDKKLLFNNIVFNTCIGLWMTLLHFSIHVLYNSKRISMYLFNHFLLCQILLIISVFQRKHVVFLISFFEFHWNWLTPLNVVAEFVYCPLYSTCSTNRSWQLFVVLLCRNQIQTNLSSIGTLGLSTQVYVGISPSLKTWHFHFVSFVFWWHSLFCTTYRVISREMVEKNYIHV